MRILTGLQYYKHKKSRLLLLVTPLFLSVILLFTIHMIIATYYNVQYNAFVETRKYYTSIQARGGLVKNDTIRTIEYYENTEKVIPCILGYTEINSVLSTVGVRVFILYQNNLQELMDKMGLKISEGRLPEPGRNEIIFHEDIIKNKDLAVGDMIGSDIVSNEKILGQYRIVGALKGKAMAGFAPLETWKTDNGVDSPEQYGVLIYAKKGKLDELNRYLSYLPLTGNNLSSYNSSLSELARSLENIYIVLNIIYGSVLIIVSICLGFLTYLFYRGRLKEFAILNIIGYSRQTIILGNITEVLVLNVLSALAGIVCSIFVIIVLNAAIFNVSGTSLLLFNGKTLILSLCVPMSSIVAQTVSIGLSFHNVDTVSVIEMESGGAA